MTRQYLLSIVRFKKIFTYSIKAVGFEERERKNRIKQKI
jgi:hypothetical protein